MQTSDTPAGRGPRIGIWGTFDLENYGDMLFPLVIEEELARRLPEARLRRLAPVGAGRPNRFDAGRPAEDLGPWSPTRVAELADELDLVVVGGGEIIHTRDELLAPHYGRSPEEMVERAPSRFFIEGLGPDLEREVPVVWTSVGIPFDPEDGEVLRRALVHRPTITVRDEISRSRLEALGLEAQVVPDPILLLPRIWGPDLLERRLRHLRAMDWYPERGWTLIAQGNRAGLPQADETAAAIDRIVEGREDPTVVIVSTGPIHGDDAFAAALKEGLGARTILLPEAGLQDVAAAIAHADGFVGSSLHGNITAAAYGRPHAILGWGGESKLEGFAALLEAPESVARTPQDLPAAFEKMEARGPRPDVLATLQDRVEKHFDRVAELAREAAARRPGGAGEGEGDALRALGELRDAYEARGRLLALGRWAAADEAATQREEARALRDEVAWLRRTVGDLERDVADRDRRIEEILTSRSWRATAWLRGLGRAGRRLLGRG